MGVKLPMYLSVPKALFYVLERTVYVLERTKEERKSSVTVCSKELQVLIEKSKMFIRTL